MRPLERTVAVQIEELSKAYLPGMIVFAAVELGLFDALDEPMPIATLAARISATEDGVARLCSALATLGFVRFESSWVCAVPEARAALARETPDSLAALVQHHHRQLLPPLARLADAIRTGQPQHAAWPFASSPTEDAPYDELVRHPDEMRALVAAMDHDSAGVGTAIAKCVDLSGARLLVDLGCGGGAVARELLLALPELLIRSFDRGAACDVARAKTAECGLEKRHFVEEGDVRGGLPVDGADVVLLSAILADHSLEDRLTILRRARIALRPGGRVIVSETLLDGDRRGPHKAALLSVLTLAVTRGDQMSGPQLFEELTEAGFTQLEMHRAPPRDLVVGVRT